MEAVNLMKAKEDISRRSPPSEGISENGSDWEVSDGLVDLEIPALSPGRPQISAWCCWRVAESPRLDEMASAGKSRCYFSHVPENGREEQESFSWDVAS